MMVYRSVEDTAYSCCSAALYRKEESTTTTASSSDNNDSATALKKKKIIKCCSLEEEENNEDQLIGFYSTNRQWREDDDEVASIEASSPSSSSSSSSCDGDDAMQMIPTPAKKFQQATKEICQPPSSRETSKSVFREESSPSSPDADFFFRKATDQQQNLSRIAAASNSRHSTPFSAAQLITQTAKHMVATAAAAAAPMVTPAEAPTTKSKAKTKAASNARHTVAPAPEQLANALSKPSAKPQPRSSPRPLERLSSRPLPDVIDPVKDNPKEKQQVNCQQQPEGKPVSPIISVVSLPRILPRSPPPRGRVRSPIVDIMAKAAESKVKLRASPPPYNRKAAAEDDWQIRSAEDLRTKGIRTSTIIEVEEIGFLVTNTGSSTFPWNSRRLRVSTISDENTAANAASASAGAGSAENDDDAENVVPLRKRCYIAVGRSPGELAAEGFQLDRVNSGTFCAVFRAIYKNKVVAVKCPDEALLKSDGDMMRYRAVQEWKILHQIKHKNILRLYGGVIYNSSQLWLVTEYMPGGDLYTLLYHRPAEYLQPRTRLNFVIQLAEAIEHLHKNAVAHKDVKCNNLLIDRNLKLSVCDFGDSEEMDGKYLQYCTAATWQYTAPELVVSPDPARPQLATESVDIWAMGCVFLEILKCPTPFVHLLDSVPEDRQRELLRHLQSEGRLKDECIIPRCLPKTFKKLVCKCLAINADDRPTASEILTFLKSQESILLEEIEIWQRSGGTTANQVKRRKLVQPAIMLSATGLPQPQPLAPRAFCYLFPPPHGLGHSLGHSLGNNLGNNLGNSLGGNSLGHSLGGNSIGGNSVGNGLGYGLGIGISNNNVDRSSWAGIASSELLRASLTNRPNLVPTIVSSSASNNGQNNNSWHNNNNLMDNNGFRRAATTFRQTLGQTQWYETPDISTTISSSSHNNHQPQQQQQQQQYRKIPSQVGASGISRDSRGSLRPFYSNSSNGGPRMMDQMYTTTTGRRFYFS